MDMITDLRSLFSVILAVGTFFSIMTMVCAPDSEKIPVDIHSLPDINEEGGEPNLFVSQSGQVFLSWIEYLGGSHVELRYSVLDGDEWSEPLKIAEGNDWFVNWADFPSLVSYADGSGLAAHWLQKSDEGTYDYDVRIAQSFDKGQNWVPSFIPHTDGVSAEHGFVSMMPLLEGDRIFATWLDGRNTRSNEESSEKSHDHGHGGAMTLRGALFNKQGRLTEEVELDQRVCDCCQTSVALTDDGLVVVYRDRSEKEIRDIYIVRKVDEKWTEPVPVHNDQWYVTGCPVNGPVVKAMGKNVAVIWFAMPKEEPQVKVAFSSDGGQNFDLPIRVDDGDPLGRVDMVYLNEREVVVSWLEQKEEHAAIRLARVHSDGTVSGKMDAVNTTSARQSGFPQMTLQKDRIILAWTAIDTTTQVKTAWIDLNQWIKSNNG